jgi:hypothetical protein
VVEVAQGHVRVRHHIQGRDAIVQKKNVPLQAIRQCAVHDHQIMTMTTIIFVDRVENVIKNQGLGRVVVLVEVIVEVDVAEVDQGVREHAVEVVVTISVSLVREVLALVRRYEQANQNLLILLLHPMLKQTAIQRMVTSYMKTIRKMEIIQKKMIETKKRFLKILSVFIFCFILNLFN